MPLVDHFNDWAPRASGSPSTRTKNFRLTVFVTVFLVIAVIGLIYNYTRTAEYRAGARVEIIPAEKAPGEPNAPVVLNSGPDGPFLTEVQLLTARASLEEVSKRVARAGFSHTLTGSDPVSDLQEMISTQPVSGTQVVQLWAVGQKPDLLPFVLNELIAIYHTQLGERFADSSADALTQARDETAKYKAAISKQRTEIEAFRLKHGIVSKERDENEATARVRGLNAAVNAAEEKAVAAQSKLASLRAAIAAGKAATRAKDNPTLAALEQRLSQAREELKQLERRYTAAYLKREPQAVALKTKIPELEGQIKREREASQQANLADAEQEVAQTQDALTSLRRQLSGNRHSVQSFAARLSEYEALQTQLESLEKLHSAAAERLVRIEAREDARKPKVRVIQAASVPTEPWRPLYHRDALFIVAGALIFGWLAAWLADFLARRESGPVVIVAPTTVAYPAGITDVTAHGAPALGAPASTPQLASPRHLPRELEDHEVKALLEAADVETRVALSALLCGVSPEELIGLKWDDLDCQANVIRLSRPVNRSFHIVPEISSLFLLLRLERKGKPEHLLLGEPGNESLPLSHLEALISYAAHDAALAQPAEITPWVIRHTFISYLVRQGIRFSDLARITGTLPAEVTAAYGTLLPAGSRRSLSDTDMVLPSLREFASALEREARNRTQE
jgi:uncharacterized protein involved in exopolysaccharide biosynthesis